MPLLEQARQGIKTQEEKIYLQQKADEICKDMRSSCEKLLIEQGKRIRMEDETANPLAKTLGRLLVAAFYSIPARKLHISAFDFMDSISLVREIDDGKGEPIQVTVVSSLAKPELSDDIKVKVQGLDEVLSLKDQYGQIVKWGFKKVDTGYGGSLQPRFDYYPERRVNLNDANSWKEDIIDKLTGASQQPYKKEV